MAARGRLCYGPGAAAGAAALGQPRWGSRSGAAAGAAAWGGSQPRRMGEELGPKHHRTYRALVPWISSHSYARAPQGQGLCPGRHTSDPTPSGRPSRVLVKVCRVGSKAPPHLPRPSSADWPTHMRARLRGKAQGLGPLPRPTHIRPHPKRPPVSRASKKLWPLPPARLAKEAGAVPGAHLPAPCALTGSSDLHKSPSAPCRRANSRHTTESSEP